MLIAGGYNASGVNDTGVVLPSTELYDPATNSFAAPSDTAVMNAARYGAVTILLPPLVTLLPTTLDFGTFYVGQSSAPSTITLSNGTAKKVKIRSTTIGRDFKVVSTTCSSTLNAGQSCTYMVSFEPRRAGTKNEVFKVTDNSGKGPLKVALQGVATRR